jgi:hypothetical protein
MVSESLSKQFQPWVSNLLSWNVVHFLLLHYCFLYIKQTPYL